MSREIAVLTGSVEEIHEEAPRVRYKPSELHVTGFNGGIRGRCVQLTTTRFAHIQLEEQEVKELVVALAQWLAGKA